MRDLYPAAFTSGKPTRGDLGQIGFALWPNPMPLLDVDGLTAVW